MYCYFDTFFLNVKKGELKITLKFFYKSCRNIEMNDSKHPFKKAFWTGNKNNKKIYQRAYS